MPTAAAALAPQVRYVHCKGVQRLPHRWVAVPLLESSAPWRAVLRALPANVPWAIEYPLIGDDLLAVTRRKIDQLRSVTPTWRAAAAFLHNPRKDAHDPRPGRDYFWRSHDAARRRPAIAWSMPKPFTSAPCAETNVAIGLARQACRSAGAAAWAPIMGRYLLAAMAKEGIDCSHVICDASQKTGFQFKGQVLDGSDPPVEYHRKGSATSFMGVEDIDSDWLLSARHLHATGVFAAISPSTLPAAQKTMDLMRAVEIAACRLTPTCAPRCGPAPP